MDLEPDEYFVPNGEDEQALRDRLRREGFVLDGTFIKHVQGGRIFKKVYIGRP